MRTNDGRGGGTPGARRKKMSKGRDELRIGRSSDDDVLGMAELGREDKKLISRYIAHWVVTMQGDIAERLGQKRREKEVDDLVDELAQYVDRVALHGESRGGFTRGQVERLERRFESFEPYYRSLRSQQLVDVLMCRTMVRKSELLWHGCEEIVMD